MVDDNMAADTGLEQIHRGGQGVSGANAAMVGQGIGGSVMPPDESGVNQRSEYFTIGMMVELQTIHNKVLKGEVVAFDLNTKMLAIKSPAVSGKQGLFDMQVVNLDFIGSINLLREAPNSTPPPLSNINFGKLRSRMQHNLTDKTKLMSYRGGNVSPLAQRLVNTITKTIADVRWEGQNIVVLDQVIISPPYTVESCRLNEKSANQIQALQHVQKLVGKFHSENVEGSSASASAT